MGKQWSIRKVITVTTLALVLFTSAVLSVIAAAALSKNLQEQIGLQLAQRARQAADRMDQFLWARNRDLLFLAGFRPVFDSGAPSTIRSALQQLQDSIPMFSWVGYTDPNGLVVAATGGILEGQSIVQRPVFFEGLKGHFMGDVHDAVLLAKLLPNPSGETMRFVDISFRIDDAEGKPMGVLAAHIDWRWLQDVRRSFLAGDTPESSELLLVSDNNREILLGPPAELGSSAASILPDGSLGNEGFFLQSGRGVDVHLYGYAVSSGYADFPGFRWTVLIREPAGSAFRGIVTQQLSLGLAGLLIALVAGAAGWIAGRWIAQPLEFLHRQAEALRQGEGESVKIRSSLKEISGLADSLNHLSRNLSKMERIALRDPLTALLNRAGTKEWVSASIGLCKRQVWGMAVLVVDLDGFKPVNDTHGHDAGDHVLKTVAARLKAMIRSDELLARWGGDEFVITLIDHDGTSGYFAASVAERILAAVKPPIPWEDAHLSVGCSIGGALWNPSEGGTWEGVLARADEALYRSKRSGKGCFTFLR